MDRLSIASLPRLVLPLVLIALVLSACHGQVGLFDVDGVTVTEEPARKPRDEGYVIDGDGATPRYSLDEARLTHPEGEVWWFTLESLPGSSSVTLYDPQGEPIASRDLAVAPLPDPGTATSVLLAVPVPGGSSVQSFQLETEYDNGSGGKRPRLADVSVSGQELDPRSGLDSRSGVTQHSGRLEVGPAVTLDSWGETDGDRTSWAITRVSEFWRPEQSAILRYTFDGEASGAAERMRDYLAAGAPGLSGGEASAAFAHPAPMPAVSIIAGGQAFTYTPRTGMGSFIIHPAVHEVDLRTIVVESELPGFRLAGVGPYEERAGVPIPVDLATLFSYPRDAWRQEAYEIFSWSRYPEVLIVDTRDYEVQSRFFKRLAFFAEKEGFRGRLLSDDELRGRHGYNAHNYNAEGLAEFFTAADREGTVLSQEERYLKELALRQGLLVRSGDGYAPGRGGILSVSQESFSVPGLRPLLLAHEALHGIYYASELFRDQVKEIWESLSDDERQFWILLLDGMQYDVTDSYLVENEFQAYLLQQSLPQVEWYFEQRSASRLRLWKPHEASWVDRFLESYPDTFLRQAVAVNAAAFEVSGFLGGAEYLLSGLEPAGR